MKNGVAMKPSLNLSRYRLPHLSSFVSIPDSEDRCDSVSKVDGTARSVSYYAPDRLRTLIHEHRDPVIHDPDKELEGLLLKASTEDFSVIEEVAALDKELLIKHINLDSSLPEEDASVLLAEGNPYNLCIKSYVISDPLMEGLTTLYDLYANGLFNAGEVLKIHQSLKDISPGEILKVNLEKGHHIIHEDLLIGRYPERTMAESEGLVKKDDIKLDPLVNWLNVLVHMKVMRSYHQGSRAVIGTEGFNFNLKPMAASIHNTHFMDRMRRSIGYGTNINIKSVGGAVDWAGSDHQWSSWISFMKGWAGIGANGKFNLEENQFSLSTLAFGGNLSGWKDYLMMGASVNIVGSSHSHYGIGGVVQMSKTRETHYRYRYHDEYDQFFQNLVSFYHTKREQVFEDVKVRFRMLRVIEHLPHGNHKDLRKSSEIKLIKDGLQNMIELNQKIEILISEKNDLKGRHFIEVIDRSSSGLRIQGGAYPASFGAGLAFRASSNRSREDRFRFYAGIERAQSLIKDGERDFDIMRLKEQFDRRDFPDLMYPEDWKVGEEVVTTLEGKVSASLVVGLAGCLKGIGTEIGTSATMLTEFELGIRKLPDHKVEVTYRPKKILERGAFAQVGGVIHAAKAKSIALAVRQTFIFDLKKLSAKDAYRRIFERGIFPEALPSSYKITKGVDERSADHFLDRVNIARRELAQKGILINYVEKVDVATDKLFLGSFLPIIGKEISRRWLDGKSTTMSTDGDIAVSRKSVFSDYVEASFSSGTRSNQTIATIKRIHSKPSQISPCNNVYQFKFGGIILRNVIHDSQVTDDENNQISNDLVKRFGGRLAHFKRKGHGQTREVVVESILESKELEQLAAIGDRLTIASERSGILVDEILSFQNKLRRDYANGQAETVECFINQYGDRGFAAIVALLDRDLNQLTVRTSSSSYSTPVETAKKLGIMFSNRSGLVDIDGKGEKRVREIFHHVRRALEDIENGLLDLHDDPYFVNDRSMVEFGPNTREHVNERRSQLFAARKRLEDFIDLERSFSKTKIAAAYRKLSSEDLSFEQRIFLLEIDSNISITPEMSKSVLVKRFRTARKLSQDIQARSDDYQNMLKLADEQHTYVPLGRSWVSHKIEQLVEMKNRVDSMLDLSHLSVKDLEEMIFTLSRSSSLGCYDPDSVDAGRIIGQMTRQLKILEKETL